ncbi:MAG TPA: hypothetical protein VIG99_21760, partial [Myxococcaceae bacterium]
LLLMSDTATASIARTLIVWDVETGRERRTLEGHTAPVTAVALSADGATAISGSSDRTVKVWDVEAGQVRRTLEGHAGRVSAVALSEDGKMVVSASHDKTLKVWAMETGACVASFTGEAAFRSVALHPSMCLLVGDRTGRVHLLELRLAPRSSPRATFAKRLLSAFRNGS